jgi:hypothetical protein
LVGFEFNRGNKKKRVCKFRIKEKPKQAQDPLPLGL